jgi:hypothetical protein
MLKEAFIQVREVSGGISRRRNALVHLHHVYGLPGNVFSCQHPQHEPRGTAAANRHDEPAASRHGRARFGSNQLGGCFGDRISVGEN